MGILIINMIFMFMLWGFALLYKPLNNKNYISSIWFFVSVIVIVIYYIVINYCFQDYIYVFDNNGLMANELLIAIPLIVMYTLLGIFIKELIYKNRFIIYPVMLILGILIFIYSIFLSSFLIIPMVFFTYMFFSFFIITILVVILLISIAAYLGRKKDKDDNYFKEEKAKSLLEKETKDIPLSNTATIFNTIFIIVLIGIIIISLLFFIM